MINTSAWVWNHCLALQKRYYRLYKKYIGCSRLQRHIAKLRKKNQHWMELNSQSVQEICQRLDASYNRFFKKIAKRPPKFKKSRNFSSFVVKTSGWKIEGNRIILNKKHTFKFSKSRDYENIKQISVKRDKLGDIYLFLKCDMNPKSYKRESNFSVGIDFGLKTYMHFSDGEKVESPLFFKAYQTEVKQANRLLSKKKKGSSNRKKANRNLARIHRTIFRKRENFQWEQAHKLCKANRFIAIEDLNIDGMKRLWGKKISDLSHSEFVKKLQFVATKYDTVIQKIGRYFPSSRMCGCGAINKELQLSDRSWICVSCGTKNHRDHLAAQNILSEGIRLYRTDCKPSVKRSKSGSKVESRVL